MGMRPLSLAHATRTRQRRSGRLPPFALDRSSVVSPAQSSFPLHSSLFRFLSLFALLFAFTSPQLIQRPPEQLRLIPSPTVPPPPSPPDDQPALLPVQTISSSVENLRQNYFASYPDFDSSPSHDIPHPPQPTQLDILPHQRHSQHENQHLREKRWSNYATVTVYVNTVTVNPAALQVVTVTYSGEAPQPAGGTVFVTVGQVTQTISNQPGVVVVGTQSTSTHTVFLGGPGQGPMTYRSTSTVVIGAQPTQVPTTGQPPYGPDRSGLPDDRPCYPGEENQKYPGTLLPTNPTQTSTLFAIGVYFVFILISWNLFLIRQLIYPVKLLVVSWHEFGHVVACACAGARLDSVTIDPNEGGATRMEAPVYPAAGLPAGYIASCIFGGLMLFCGFNTLASKVASFIIGMSFMVVFWWASGMLTRLLTLGAIGLMIGFWFIDHAGVLRYYVLFIGVMSSWYILYDVMDDFVFRKLNPCCPVLFEERFPFIRAGYWAVLWMIISSINFTAWILLALAVWRQTPRGMYCQSQQFLPT